ncbi:MAG: CPBP family intramembrane glutamic endopeptidase [Candidatus Dormibacteria bacterium]
MGPGLAVCGLPGLLRIRARGGDPARARQVVGGAVVGAGVYAVAGSSSLLLARWSWGRRSLVRLARCRGAMPVGLAAAVAAVASAGEEIFWRESWLGTGLERSREEALAPLWRSTLAYAAVQAASLDPVLPLGAVLLGAVTGWLRIRSRSIWPGVAAHVLFSELALVAPGLASPSPDPQGSDFQDTTVTRL